MTDQLVPHAADTRPQRLQCDYQLWFSRRAPGKLTANQDWTANLRPVASFGSVDQFWSLYCHLLRPNELNGHCDLHVFKSGIHPTWEDAANKDGGKWIVRVRKGLASRLWENLLLALIGEQFMVGDEVCGAVVSCRFQEDILSVWNRTANDTFTTGRIRDTLRRVLNLPPNKWMEYESHAQACQTSRSGLDCPGFGVRVQGPGERCFCLCPSLTRGCNCTENPLILNCTNTEFPDNLAKIDFDAIYLTNVTSRVTKLSEVKTGHLDIFKESSNIHDISPFLAMEFTLLRLVNINMQLIDQFFSQQYNHSIRIVSITGGNFDKLNLTLANFAKVEYIYMTQVRRIPPRAFAELTNLEYIQFYGVGLEELNEDSLQMASTHKVKVNLPNNLLTEEQLNKSNLYNEQGAFLNLASNKVRSLPASVFEKYVEQGDLYSIDLEDNPVYCDCEEIGWVFKYDLDETFPLKNVRCVNFEGKSLLNLDEDDCKDIYRERERAAWLLYAIYVSIVILFTIILVISCKLIRYKDKSHIYDYMSNEHIYETLEKPPRLPPRQYQEDSNLVRIFAINIDSNQDEHDTYINASTASIGPASIPSSECDNETIEHGSLSRSSKSSKIYLSWKRKNYYDAFGK